MSNGTVNIGVIGVGDMGERHAVNFSRHVAGASVVALMDKDEARLAKMATECAGSRTFADGQALIADASVDAVVIAAPDAFHAELVQACLDAGKPVLCEKPLATNASDAEAIFRREVELGRTLVQVGFMREYDQAHQDLKAALADVGSPLLFRGFHYNPSKGVARHIDDVITNSAIHDIHSAHWLVGEEIVEVYTRHIPHAVDRHETCRLLVLHLTFRSGALGIIQVNSESGYGYEVAVEITGASGQITTAPVARPLVRNRGGLTQAIDTHFLDRFGEAYVREAQSWVAGLPSASGPTAWDGYTSLIVADACKRSFRSGAPESVSVPDRPDLYALR